MTKETIAGLVLALTFLIGVVVYSIYKNEVTTANRPVNLVSEVNSVESKVNSSGIVSVLTEIPNTNNAVNSTDKTSTLTISTPEEWEPIDTIDEVKSCDPSQQAEVKSYISGTKTITIYENSTPSGCDNKTIGDVNVSFVYSKKGEFIVQKKDSYEQCTKAQNPTCPKGDGKATVFITSTNTENKENKNPITDNTYAFRIEDTSIADDFSKQIGELISLIEKISFRYQ